LFLWEPTVLESLQQRYLKAVPQSAMHVMLTTTAHHSV
jgi:hypothetical protein